jgi:ABC-type microcin C transport system duplicated ATPase subunit YejF
MRGRTTFVIAHRLSTVRRADQILVVEAGQIIEHGRHESLYAASGRYFDLYTKQHGLESNLFLAPGEAAAEIAESADGEAPSTTGSNNVSDSGLSDAIRLIRGREP